MEIHGNIQAIVLIAISVYSILIIVRWRRKKFENRQLLWGFAGIVPFTAVFALLGSHGCDAGMPIRQWNVPAICAFLIVILVEPKHLRHISYVILLLSAVALTMHFVEIIHTTGYTGNPKSPINRTKRLENLARYSIEKITKVSQDDDTEVPEGWCRDVLPDNLKELIIRQEFPKSKAIPLWHSPITRLYLLEAENRDLWYPGGKLSESAEKIELRKIFN